MCALKKLGSILFIIIVSPFTSCVDNQLDVEPNDENYPFRLILDADEGGDLPDAEDYGLEVKFADFIGDLPGTTITVDYEITDLTDDMIGAVEIDEILFEADDEEFNLDFTPGADGLSGTITLNDPSSGEVPQAFEVIFKLPGVEGVFFAAGGFKFSLTNLQSGGENIEIGTPYEFEYEVLDHELAGKWKFEINNVDAFNSFKEVFGPISPELEVLEFAEVKAGEAVEVEFEFEFDEVAITLVYLDESDEEVEIEVEAEYDFDDETDEIEFEGSHLIIGDDDEIEDELDFIIGAEYNLGGELGLTFFTVIDEDNYEEGEELFLSESGNTFLLEKDQ